LCKLYVAAFVLCFIHMSYFNNKKFIVNRKNHEFGPVYKILTRIIKSFPGFGILDMC